VKNDALAIDRWKKAAMGGNISAKYQLALCYQEGIVVEKDVVKGLSLLTEAADGGNADAQYNLGCDYYYGDHDIVVDKMKAVEYFRKAAEQGHAYAQLSLGSCYFRGEGGLHINNDEGLRLFQEAANQGDAYSQLYLGLYYASYARLHLGKDYVSDYKKAIELLKKAANQNLALAKYYLADLYETYSADLALTSPEADLSFALQIFPLYEEAADAGLAAAQYCVGVSYELGSRIQKDWYKAIEYYAKAAKQGYKENIFDAQAKLDKIESAGDNSDEIDMLNALAIHYYKGEYLKKNEIKAFELFQKVVELANSSTSNKMYLAESLYYLGLIYSNGIKDSEQVVLKASKSKAKSCFKKAVDAGYDEAINALASLNKAK